jgi:hypothetical protein
MLPIHYDKIARHPRSTTCPTRPKQREATSMYPRHLPDPAHPSHHPSARIPPIKWADGLGAAQPQQPAPPTRHSGSVAIPPVHWATTGSRGQTPSTRVMQPTLPAVAIPPVRMPQAARAVQATVDTPQPMERPAASPPLVRWQPTPGTAEPAGAGSHRQGTIQRHITGATPGRHTARTIPSVRMPKQSLAVQPQTAEAPHPKRQAGLTPAVQKATSARSARAKMDASVPRSWGGAARPPAHSPGRPAPTSTVVQKMELWDKFTAGVKAVGKGVEKVGEGIQAVGMSIINGTPNPFQMESFTSCICFVFNVAGKSLEEFTAGWLYKHIFDSIKDSWTHWKTQAPFYALCPYDEQGDLTAECADVWKKSDIGDRPLIVVIGHCSRGGAVITNDAKDKTYSIKEVIDAILPTLRNRCTIYLTPCYTGVANPSVPGSKSFQERFTKKLNKRFEENYFTIGTTSMSVPLAGKVHTPGQTYTHRETPLKEEDYFAQQ